MPFNGERLKQARVLRGLTVAELAERVAQQRQTLSMYEINKSQPSEATIEAISRELNFPKRFFYEESVGTQGTVYFRSLLTTNKRYRSEQIAKMKIIAQIYHLLQDYIEFPAFDSSDIPSGFSPEEAAGYLRDIWDLGQGPIDNIVPLVEQHGILVTTFSTSTDDIDAFSEPLVVDGSSTFLIAYSNNKTSAARVHFDIAHELGHIVMHEWSDDIEELSKEEFKAREQQANDFAAAFLLPPDAFKKDLLAGEPYSLAYYKQLKRKWRVSIAAMIRRARDLNVITTEDYQMLLRTMQRRGQRKEEPLDDVLVTASPALLRTSVIMLLQESVFTPQEFMDELSSDYGLSIYPEDVEELLNLPDHTLALQNIINISAFLKTKPNPKTQ